MKIMIQHWMIGLASLGLVSLAHPQGLSTLQGADRDWSKLTSAGTPVAPAASGGIDRAVDQKKTAVQQIVENLQQNARDAKSFYINYPGDPRASVARKLEITSSLQSAQLGAVQARVPAFVLADAYRRDHSVSPKDRFDVALAMETVLVAPALNGQRLSDAGALFEELADKLYAEFGGSPEVGGLYLNLLRTADFSTATRVATKLRKMAVSSSVLRDAELTLVRNGRVGKRVEELSLATVDGQKIDFSSIREVTAVYFWNTASGTGDLELLARLGKTVPPGIRWIYIGLGTELPPIATVVAQSPFPGQQCFDPSSLGGAAATVLGAQQAPYISVIGRDGTLVSFGRVEDAVKLIAAANR